MKFPKPEKGMARYEVWEGHCTRHTYWYLATSCRSKASARQEMMKWSTAEGMAAYIYDRRTGTVIETNEEALKKAEVDANCG